MNADQNINPAPRPTAACPNVASAAGSVVASRPHDEHATSSQLVDAVYKAFGRHHARAIHAKGVVLEGSFTPTLEARGLSKASLFVGPAPVLVRFSNFTGLPDIPDTADAANPRGFAVKLHLADGSDTDIVAHSFNGFPAATSEEFRQLLLAIAASGLAAAKPTALDQFLGRHPIAKTFLTAQKPAPVSYATLTYFGVNSFKFIDAEHHATYVRYRFVPKSGEQLLDAAALKSKGPNYLFDEIAQRVAGLPVHFDWLAQISGLGDVIDNPSIAWPENRRLVKLGTISIVRMIASQAWANKAILFLPGDLPAGIEAADPMISARNEAYPISYENRQ